MNQKELARRVTAVMRERDIRKPISIPKQVFHISDDDGNTKSFSVKKRDKSVIYTVDDVDAVVDACIEVMKDALKRGDNISVRGFGTLGLKLRKARHTKRIGTNERIDIDAHYIPKFSFGADLKMCAKLYELSLTDKDTDADNETNKAVGVYESGGG